LSGTSSLPEMKWKTRRKLRILDFDIENRPLLGHDLPIINGALIELGMPLLKPKLVQDTRKHLIRSKDMPLSQEALAEYFGLTYGKEHMSQPAWRKANRLGEAGAPLTRARVVGDVQQHKALRLALLEKGYLRPPARWSP
jgi:hypothetical protein